MKFSANLGFLWADRPLPDGIGAAKAAGFDAVECHWPYGTPAKDVLAALNEMGQTMFDLNTRFGESGLPARAGNARDATDQALNRATGRRAVDVMAGNASSAQTRAAFVTNLPYACAHAIAITTPIEPRNRPEPLFEQRRPCRAVAADRAYSDCPGSGSRHAGSWRIGLWLCVGAYRKTWLDCTFWGGISASG